MPRTPLFLRYIFQLIFIATCATLSSKPALHNKPRVSIITSVYKGDEFIRGFLEDIVRQTIFEACELIIINADSPGNEEPVILEYRNRYPNIIYLRLKQDPGLYAVWNIAIKMARADFITNANIDDRRNPKSLEKQVKVLERHPEIALVYSNFYVTQIANINFERAEEEDLPAVKVLKFALERLHICFVGPQPMWRKSVHATCGYFDESYKSAGDWEFWNRMASKGFIFKKLRTISGVYFNNPLGLSSHKDQERQARNTAENNRIIRQYNGMWSYST